MTGFHLIQLILLVVIVAVFVKIMLARGTHARGAWQKSGVTMLAVIMVASVLFPDNVTQIANLVGVGRGTDLVVYLLFITFIFYVINQYLKGHEQRDVTYRLARKVALLDAASRYRNVSRDTATSKNKASKKRKGE